MKARLVLAAIVLGLFGMSSTLYFVLKKSPQYRIEAGTQMAETWIKAKQLRWGPYDVAGQTVFVNLPDLAQDWNFDPRGEELWVQPKWVKIEPTSVATAQVWSLLSEDLQKALSQVLNFPAGKGVVKFSPPANP